VEKLIVPMRDKPKRFSGNIPWCRIEDFDGKYLYTSKSGRFVDQSIIDEWNLKVFPKGTVICSCSANIGVCSIAGNPLVTNQTFIGIVPNETLNQEFLFYLMGFYAERLTALSGGTTISYLSREEFERFQIVKPPLDEQKKIVIMLDFISSLIDNMRSNILKTKNLRKKLNDSFLSGEILVPQEVVN
jgi:type I restriction enzyme S subunit